MKQEKKLIHHCPLTPYPFHHARFKGMYCEDSVYAARVCETLKACVLCKAWGRELAKCEQCQITISIVDMLGNYHHHNTSITCTAHHHIPAAPCRHILPPYSALTS